MAVDVVGHNLRTRRAKDETPLATVLHMGLAWPLYRAYSWLQSSPPAIHIQSLMVTITGLTRMATGDWAALCAGALFVYLGHIIAHAARILARHKGITAWGRFLDQSVGRIVELAMFVLLAWTEVRGVGGVPGWLPPAWAPFDTAAFVALCGAAVASVLLVRYLEVTQDVLLLRTHLLSSRHVPGPTAFQDRKRGMAVSRDVLFMMWLLAVVLHQVQAFVLLVVAMHAVTALANIGRFHRNMANPADEATWVLSRDYQR